MKRYKRETLSMLSRMSIVRELKQMGEGLDVVLLCFERPGDFCHRNLVAEWLNEGGIECEELKF